MDTFIFQQTFSFIDGVLQDTNETNIIPAYISSLAHRNNYQPTPAEGTEAERILERIEQYSQQIGN
jgi:poly-gamma-glutamate synthesis protein (capsule biosynthesis protein)